MISFDQRQTGIQEKAGVMKNEIQKSCKQQEIFMDDCWTWRNRKSGSFLVFTVKDPHAL